VHIALTWPSLLALGFVLGSVVVWFFTLFARDQRLAKEPWQDLAEKAKHGLAGQDAIVESIRLQRVVLGELHTSTIRLNVVLIALTIVLIALTIALVYFAAHR